MSIFTLGLLAAALALCLQSTVVHVFVGKSVCQLASASCELSKEGSRGIPNVLPESSQPGPTSSREETPTYPDDVTELTVKLVSIPSPSGAEHQVGRYIAGWLKAHGWRVTMPDVEDKVANPNPRFNVVALAPGIEGPEDVRVILSTHFDTVPLGSGGPRIERGRVHGRGSVDAKGIVASMMVAGQNLTSETAGVPLALLFVCAEEVDHAGMNAANDVGFPPDVSIVNGEPTTGKLCVKQKGILKLTLEAQGVSCHSGYPELGSSAIDTLLDALGKLRLQNWPVDAETGAETTVNIGVIGGGSAANVVPGSARAELMFRLIEDETSVVNIIQNVLQGFPNITSKIISRNPPQRMYAPPRALDAFGTYTAAYNTDLSYFKRAGKKILFGGGTIANAHVEDEYIALDELKQMPGQYQTIAKELLEEKAAT